VIDPIDPDRNLGAAVREDKLWGFVAASREIRKNPGLWYFFPPKSEPRTRAHFSKLIEAQDRDIVAISFHHARIVPDVLWGQLLRIEKSLVDLMARQDFHPIRSAVWSDEDRSSAILVEMDSSTLGKVRLRQGPPVSKHEDSQSFLNRHLFSKDTVRGPWLEEDRWIVDKKREFLSVEKMINVALRDPKLGLSIPQQMGTSFKRNATVLVNQKILRLVGQEGFEEVLSEFLAAKPSWLKPHQ
jgi:tRNA nucleotidyltransferase (CCA-adding enzyme)